MRVLLLIKAAARFFFRSKITMLLILIIVTFMSAIFSLINFSSQKMTQSFDNIVESGRLHDFTIDENYKSPNPSLAYVVKFDPSLQKVMIREEEKGSFLSAISFFNNDKNEERIYLYISSSRLGSTVKKDGKINNEQIAVLSFTRKVLGIVKDKSQAKEPWFFIDPINSVALISKNDFLKFNLEDLNFLSLNSVTDIKKPEKIFSSDTNEEFTILISELIENINLKLTASSSAPLTVEVDYEKSTGDFKKYYDDPNHQAYLKSVETKEYKIFDFFNEQEYEPIPGSNLSIIKTESLNPKILNNLKNTINEIETSLAKSLNYSRDGIKNLISEKIENNSEFSDLKANDKSLLVEMSEVKSADIYLRDKNNESKSKTFKFVTASNQEKVNKIIINKGANIDYYNTSSELERIINKSKEKNSDFPLIFDEFAENFYGEAIKYGLKSNVNQKFKISEKGEITLSELSEVNTLNWEDIFKNFTFGNSTLGNFPNLSNDYFQNGNYVSSFIKLSNPLSVQAIVSSEFAKENKLIPVSKEKLYGTSESGKNLYFDDFGNFNDFEFKRDYPYSSIKLDSGSFAIVGIGDSPDFAYPVIDRKSIDVDSKNQGVLYVNNGGYENSINPVNRILGYEDYLAFRVRDDVIGKRRQIIIDKSIDSLSDIFKGDELITSAIRKTYEKNILGNLAAIRIDTLKSIKNIFNTIAIGFLVLMLLIGLTIITLIVRRKLKSTISILGIMEANGFSKSEITLAYMFVPVLLSVIGLVTGYLIAYFAQNLVFNLFDNYWTIATDKIGFSPIIFILSIIIPTLCLIVTLSFASWVTLKRPIYIKINNSDSIPNYWNFLAMKINLLPIRQKFAFSVFSSNFTKMLMISISTTAAVSAATIALSSLSKFDQAVKQNSNTQKFNMMIDLKTPTLQGGQYSALELNDNKGTNFNAGYSLIKDKPLNANDVINGTKWSQSYYYNASLDSGDIPTEPSSINFNPRYLNHRVVFKPNIDFPLGFPISVNPWENFFLKIPIINSIAGKFTANHNEIKETIPEATNNSRYFTELGNRQSSFIDDRTENVEYNSGKVEPLLGVFNQLIVNSGDENYTYIDASSPGKWNYDLKIVGIKLKSKLYRFNTVNQKILENYQNAEFDPLKEYIPVIINRFVEEKYKLNLNDEFNINVKNMVDRIGKNSESEKNSSRKVKVVGIMNTYKGEEIFTLQKFANQVLIGSTPLDGKKTISNNKSKNDKENNFFSDSSASVFKNSKGQPYLFNGIMTSAKSPRAFTNFSFYSFSGLYPLLDQNKNTSKVFKAKFKEKSEEISIFDEIYKQFQKSTGIEREADKLFTEETFIDNHLETLSDSFLTPLIKTYVTSDQIQNQLLTAGSFVGGVTWTLLLTCLVILMIFSIVISIILLDDNRRNILMLKVLGYSNNEVSVIFSATYIPTLLFGILISVPLSILFIYLLKLFLINFADMTAPFSIISWETLVSIGVGALLFIFFFFGSLLFLKQSRKKAYEN